MNVQGLIAVYEKLNKCSISRRRDDRFTRKLFYLEVKHGLYFLEFPTIIWQRFPETNAGSGLFYGDGNFVSFYMKLGYQCVGHVFRFFTNIIYV